MDEHLPHQPMASAPPAASPSSASVRRNSLPAVLIATAILGASFVVRPDPRGYGTHQQLLMPPCLFRLATGEPCPFCGMTTGFAHMARGQLLAAGRANLMAPVGFVLTVLALIGGLYGLCSGRRWVPAWVQGKAANRALPYIVGAFWAANLALRHWPAPPT